MYRYIMTKTQYKRIFDNIIKKFTICSTSKQTYRQNITGDKNVRLDENSLQPRILKYFKDCLNQDQAPINLTLTNSNWDNLSVLSNKELAEVIISLPEATFRRTDIKNYLKYLDKECCSRLPELQPEEIFKFLHSFMSVIPNIITRLTFYSQAIYKLSYIIDRCSKLEILQICFYAALQKKNKQSSIILKDCLKKFNFYYLDNLNINDLAVLCSASYKTSTKIQYRKLLEKITDTLYNNLNILSDTTIFITLIKCLRQNQSQNEELLTTISNTIFFNNTIKNYNFTAYAHILALYADALYFDENLFSLITNNCFTLLRDSKPIIAKDEYFINQIRAKDVDRFLWALSYINYDNFDENVTEYVLSILEGHIDLGELEKNIEYFVNSVLSLWILGQTIPTDFFTSVINKNTISLIYGKGKRRYTARLNLLLTSVQWEQPDLINTIAVSGTKPTPWNQSNQMRNRPYLKIIHNALNNISNHVNIKKFEFSSPVPHLNIIGITGYDKNDKERLYIELFDELMLIKNKDGTPHGLMKLKIRLLRTLNKPQLIIFKENIENLSQKEMEKYLQKKLKLILSS